MTVRKLDIADPPKLDFLQIPGFEKYQAAYDGWFRELRGLFNDAILATQLQYLESAARTLVEEDRLRYSMATKLEIGTPAYNQTATAVRGEVQLRKQCLRAAGLTSDSNLVSRKRRERAAVDRPPSKWDKLLNDD